MRRLILIFAICTGVLWGGPAGAGEAFGRTAAAYNRGDYAEALDGLRVLAEQGYAIAQAKLGGMYDEGEGVSQDYAKAMKWYRKAAEQGYAGGQFNLGLMYYMGQGVPQDYVQAHLWSNLAAAQGLKGAKKGRDMIAEKMTPSQIEKAQTLATEWRPKK